MPIADLTTLSTDQLDPAAHHAADVVDELATKLAAIVAEQERRGLLPLRRLSALLEPWRAFRALS